MKKRMIRIAAAALLLAIIAGAAVSVNAAPAPQLRYIVGDVDIDGELNIVDATALQRGLAGLKELSAIQRFIADVDRDGEMSVIDATIIQRNLAGISNDFWGYSFSVYGHDIRSLTLSGISVYHEGSTRTYVGCNVRISYTVTGGYTYDSRVKKRYDIFIDGALFKSTEDTSAEYAFDKAGEYTVTVRSSDIFGMSDSKSAVITVTASPDMPYLTDALVDLEEKLIRVKAAGGTGDYLYKYYIIPEMVTEPSDAPTDPEPSEPCAGSSEAIEPATEAPTQGPTFYIDPAPGGIFELISGYIPEDAIQIPADKLTKGVIYDYYVQITDSAGHETEMLCIGHSG